MYCYTSLLDLALLSKKVYGGFKESDFPSLKSMSSLWHPIIETSSNPKMAQDTGDPRKGFYSCVYENFATKERVLVIKGTNPDSKSDIFTDLQYGITNIINSKWDMSEYKELQNYMFYLSTIFGENYYNEQNNENNYFNIKYICGHSLGGIMAKMIACQYNLDVVAFNSPSVKNILQQYNIVKHYKSIATVYCKNDPVTNLDTDFLGKKYVLDAGFKTTEKVNFTNIRNTLNKEIDDYKNDVELVNKSTNSMPELHNGSLGFEIGSAIGKIFKETKEIRENKDFRKHIGEEALYQHSINTVINMMINNTDFRKITSI